MTDVEFIITGDGSHTLFRPDLNETYHSRHGAIKESLHVFIKHGLQHYTNQRNVSEVKILEIGFGTGLNAWLTCLESNKLQKKILYSSLEPYPLSDDVINKLNYTADSDTDEAAIFSLIHKTDWGKESKISPFFFLQKLNLKLQEFHGHDFDIIYFDAFAPEKQPDLWELEIFHKLYQMLSAHGIIVSYCAKGQFKRDLKAVGFIVESLVGPPGKKEMVRGLKG